MKRSNASKYGRGRSERGRTIFKKIVAKRRNNPIINQTDVNSRHVT